MKAFQDVVLFASFFLSSALCISTSGKRLLSSVGPLLDAAKSGHVSSKSTTQGFGNPKIPMNVEWFPEAYEIINDTAQFFPDRGSKRVRMRYGPFNVDPMSEHESMVDELQIGAQMPCTDCTITFMQASLEYPNGTYANANTSLWLHHIVLINLARPDTVCGSQYYGRGQRWFASGNERTPVSYSLDGHLPVGYYIAPGDSMVLEAELMSQSMYPQQAVPVLTFEYIEGKPIDFYESRPIWMDIGGCKIASDMPAKGEVFSYTAPSYTATFNGALIGMGAHLHDGGVNVEIWQDLKKQLCNSVAYYGDQPGYVDAPGTSMVMPMQPMFRPMKHISYMSYCYAPLGQVVNGSTLLDITANYNFTEHMPMLTLDGGYDEIMGISVIYTAENMTADTLASFLGNTTLPLTPTPSMTGMDGMGMMSGMSSDDDDSGAGGSASASSDMAGMGGMGGMMSMNAMSCVPMRDSPGTITLQNLNTTDESTMTTLLSAILCDSCLQAWSAPYARYFWYGIVAVIGLASLSRLLTWQTLLLRKHEASKVHSDVYEMPASVSHPASFLARLARRVSYRQYTPVMVPSFVKLPTTGIVLMVVAYFAFLLGLQFSNASTGDLQTYQFLSVRAAWLSVAQLPLIVLLSAKRNLITMVTAVTYERLNVLHRWTARGLLMTAAMHFGFQWHGWVKAGVLKYELSDMCVPSGAATFALVLWMNVSTLAPFRNMAYELFVAQHIFTFYGLIIAVAYHVPTTAPYALTYVYVSAALYLATKLYQLAVYARTNIRPARAALSPVSDRITKVSIPAPKGFSWQPGQFVLVSLPRLGIFQSHPATISTLSPSSSRSSPATIDLFLSRRGGFTSRIARPAAQSAATYTALLDGPFGGSHHDFACYHTAVLLSGSSGLTFALALLRDLARRSARAAHGRLPLRRLRFVHASYDGALSGFLRREIFAAAARLLAAGVDVRVDVHVTGTYRASNPFAGLEQERVSVDDEDDEAEGDYDEKTRVRGTGLARAAPELPQVCLTSSSQDDSDSSHSGGGGDCALADEKHAATAAMRPARSDSSGSASSGGERSGSKGGDEVQRRISVAAGRPMLGDVLRQAKDACEGEMAVACCGPLGMSVEVRNLVAGMQTGSGVYLHVEGFAW